jgi:3-mercaptopyruvate sulfurtransferase SseA
MYIEKSKLPKGMSYPLKSSVLETALDSGGITLNTHLIYYGIGKFFFDAHFWLTNQNVPYERLYIRTSAVPAADATDARTFMTTTVIPEFVTWVQGILSLPPN